MPLSEQEQKLLDEMERSLYHNDADFVSAVNAGRGKLNYGALVLGILLAVVGLVVVIVGVITHLLIVGLLGFVAMFPACCWRSVPRSRPSAVPSPGREPRHRRAAPHPRPTSWTDSTSAGTSARIARSRPRAHPPPPTSTSGADLRVGPFFGVSEPFFSARAENPSIFLHQEIARDCADLGIKNGTGRRKIIVWWCEVE